jgi:anti-sigma B factor antagonist
VGGEIDGTKAVRPRQGAIHGGIESKCEDDLDLVGPSFDDSTGLSAYMRTEQAGAFTICRPVGELDAFSVTRFRRAFAAVALAPRLIIDLADVGFVDSAGVGALIGGIRRVRELGGEVAVACPRAGLNRVLHTAGLDRLVTVVSSVDEAVVALGSALEARRPTGPSRRP